MQNKALRVTKLYYKPVGDEDSEWHEIKGECKIEPEINPEESSADIFNPKCTYTLSCNIVLPKLRLSRAQKRHLRRKYGRKHWVSAYRFDLMRRGLL